MTTAKQKGDRACLKFGGAPTEQQMSCLCTVGSNAYSDKL